MYFRQFCVCYNDPTEASEFFFRPQADRDTHSGLPHKNRTQLEQIKCDWPLSNMQMTFASNLHSSMPQMSSSFAGHTYRVHNERVTKNITCYRQQDKILDLEISYRDGNHKHQLNIDSSWQVRDKCQKVTMHVSKSWMIIGMYGLKNKGGGHITTLGFVFRMKKNKEESQKPISSSSNSFYQHL